jgi:hypothetical protein
MLRIGPLKLEELNSFVVSGMNLELSMIKLVSNLTS